MQVHSWRHRALALSLCLLVLCLPIVLGQAATSGDKNSVEDAWPQFRGPEGQGHTTARGLPIEWSETKNVAWKTALPGSGHSSPVIGRGLAWLTAAKEEGRSLWVLAVDVETGAIVHEREVLRTDNPPHLNAKNSSASPTPVLEGDRVYVHFGDPGTACLSTATAETIWTNQELKLDHGEGAGSSPIIWRDLLIVNCDGCDVQYVAALNKQTGKIVWKTDRVGELPAAAEQRKAFCTPLVIEVDDHLELISPGSQRVFAYDPATGKPLWKVEYPPGFSNVPRPLFGNGLLYICTGYGHLQLWAIRPGGQGDVSEKHVVWKVTQNVPANPSPVLVDDLLFMINDAGIASCIDSKTGDSIWRKRLGDNFSASPLYADGKIYFWSEGGETTVIEAARKFKEMAKNSLGDGFMASPACIDSALIVRSRTHLYRLEEGATASHE